MLGAESASGVELYWARRDMESVSDVENISGERVYL